MEKLKLKHVSPYLPYGLETSFLLSDVVYTKSEEIRNKLLTADNISFVLNFCNPILRPLSDLTKEIEVNREKFVPIEVLRNHLFFSETNEDMAKHLITLINFDIENVAPYWVMEKLLEWHFDIFGLIEKGLAIDKNTL